MALTFYNVKKWWKMLWGKSIYHVNQNEGLIYSFKEIKGYYNNLTEKVTLDRERYNSIEPITVKDGKGVDFYFSIAVFQYGLGVYDLYLLNVDKELMKKKFIAQVEWAFLNQNKNGSWNTFNYKYPDSPFSAMAQGEGCSLFIRAFIETGNLKYKEAAKKALDFMLLPLENGGTAEYVNDGIILYEFTNFPYVYNGWIFGIFGLMDYVILTDDKFYKNILNQTINALKSRIKDMDLGYWSKYRNDKMIASPFYHNLHIAQLSVIAKYTSLDVFKELVLRFQKYQKNPFKKTRAFFRKSFQKIAEKGEQ